MDCFIPSCPNTSSNCPNKLFVKIREDLKKTWCSQVNAVNSPIYLMYCCEDHLDLKEDLKNYNRWRVFGDTPILKPTAKLRNIPNHPDAETFQSNVMPSTEQGSSLLMKMLIRKSDNEVESCAKKRKSDDVNITDSQITSIPLKVQVGVQCQVKMLKMDKSTNYSARKEKTSTEKAAVIHSSTSSPSISVTSPSLFSATETETTVAEVESALQTESIRTNLLELIQKKSKMYLGLPPKFLWLIEYIIKKNNIKKNLCVIITLFKLKQNDSLQRMSDEFEISRASLTILFAQGVEILANFFQNLIFMPSPLQIKKNLPLVFKIRYSNVQMIIDCFEIQIEKPADPTKQAQTWSQYKNCNTIKYLIGSTPNGFVNFISAGYGGRISDKALVMESRLIDVLPQNAEVLADRGFKEVESTFASKGVRLLRPPSVSASQKPTRLEVLRSKTIASLRVHIERVIRRIREFRLLKPHSVVNTKHVAYLDELVIIACGLINLQSEIIQKQ